MEKFVAKINGSHSDGGSKKVIQFVDGLIETHREQLITQEIPDDLITERPPAENWPPRLYLRLGDGREVELKRNTSSVAIWVIQTKENGEVWAVLQFWIWPLSKMEQSIIPPRLLGTLPEPLMWFFPDSSFSEGATGNKKWGLRSEVLTFRKQLAEKLLSDI